MRSLSIVLVLAVSSADSRANQVSLAPVARQSITGWGVELNVYGHGVVYVGFHTAYDVVWRGMMRFDLTSVPVGSRVNAAVLRMTPFNTLYADSTPFYLHRLTTAWTPGSATNWTQPWTLAGGDFAPASASTTTPLGGLTIFQGTAFTADVQRWVTTPATNHGCIVIEPVNWGEAQYAAIELVVDFDPPCAAPTMYCVGAPNSVGPGAAIGSRGSTRISDANFTLLTHGIRRGAAGSFFFGAQQQQVPWGDGFLCIGGQLRRLGPTLFADVQGIMALPVDFASSAASVIAPGSTWNFQLVYRDAAAGGAGFNSTNALQATFCN